MKELFAYRDTHTSTVYLNEKFELQFSTCIYNLLSKIHEKLRSSNKLKVTLSSVQYCSSFVNKIRSDPELQQFWNKNESRQLCSRD